MKEIFQEKERFKLFFGILLAVFSLILTASSYAGLSSNYIKNNVDGTQTLTGHVPREVSSSTASFKSHADRDINARIILPLNNQAQLSSLIQDLYDPKSPNFHHFLTPAQFAQQFSPSTIDTTMIQEYLQQEGVFITGQSANGAVLYVTGRVKAFEQAFGLHINNYQKSDGTLFFAPDADPTIPAVLADKILAVGGLDNLPKYRTHVHQNAKVLPKAVGSGPGGFLAPQDIKTAYNLNTVTATGLGQSIALVELDGYSSSDITAFESYFGLPSVPLQNVPIDGFNEVPNYGSTGGAGEVTLDIESLAAYAPGSSNIYVYEAANTTQAWIDEWTKIATDDKAKVISCSWGEPEKDSPTLSFDNTILQEMAVQGQAVFVAAGDDGAYDAGGNKLAIDEPASQPYATAVGISTLTTNSNGTYSSETASVYGGGGISAEYSIPSYQIPLATLAVRAALVSTTMRNTPDVVLTADYSTPYAFYIEGFWGGYWGSSIAAPIWASFISRVNQGLGVNGPIGSVNSALYQLAQGSNYRNDFHDISTGNNSYYPAETGFDDATGLGSFNGYNLYHDLVPPIVPAVSMTTNNSSYIAPATIVLTATASEANGSISKVAFYNGSTLLATVTSSPYTYTWSNVPTGSYGLLAIATDPNSVSTTSSTDVITVAPASITNLSLTYPATSSGQIVDAFSSNQALVRANVTVQVASPSAPGTWYTLSSNYGFIANGGNSYSVTFPASGYPANMLVKLAGQSPQQVIYTIASSAGSGGAISPSGSITVNSGASQVFTLTPNTGYTASLTVDGSTVALTNNAYTLSNVTAVHTVTASFTPIIITNFSLTYPATSSGQIVDAFSSNQAIARANVTVQVASPSAPGTWYTLSSNYGFIANGGNSYSVTFPASSYPANMLVKIAGQSPQQVIYTIASSAGSGGAISPSGTITVNSGASQVFTLTPNTGYTASLTVDGSTVTLTNNTYALSNVTAVHSLVASFTVTSPISNLTITYPSISTGQITVNFSSTVALTRSNLIVQVAAPSAPTVWYTLSGNYSLVSDGGNRYTVLLPASGYPANVLVNIEVKPS